MPPKPAPAPTPSQQPDVWDQVVEDSTRKFNYDDSTVRLLVGDIKFQVSRRLLSTTSDIFADMFTLPEGEGSQEVVLHNDPEEFRHFLWFLHVEYATHSARDDAIWTVLNKIISVTSMEQYNSSASPETRFARALGIATVAHMYSATRVFAWAVAELLRHLASNRNNRDIMARAYRLAAGVTDQPNLLAAVRTEWIQGLQHSNPVAILAAAKSVGDSGLLGWAYFTIIQTQNAGWIAKEPSLTPLDRTRLVVGALNLRRWEPRYNNSGYYVNNDAPRDTNVKAWSLKINQNMSVTSWDPQQLWEIFSRSPFGLKFNDEIDMSVHDDRPQKVT